MSSTFCRCRIGLVSFLLVTFIGNSAFAQILPDTTLGNENSLVTPVSPTVDQINGGATRGANLFHSFIEFNVGEGRSVFFTNPAGIDNILTRVTGTNPSNILGMLGVTGGNANLFLINPNGIIFGHNARLDVSGSFVASTASSFKFPDGSEFSAINPQAPPLLTVNVTPGVQWGTSKPGATITNRGNLAAQQNLTLVADKLDLQGQLEAGGDLTLWAQDTVKVRDSVTTPFLALSGGNLTVEGNSGIDILALNHPTQTPFVSGGNLSLVSDGMISGDARFSSGGSFSIRSVSGGLANFFSEHDPIISASGDVDVAANYTGASLLVESKGNIRFGGDINITKPDTSTLPAGPDTATLSTGSALIMRSGQSTLAYGGVNSGGVPAYGTGGLPEGITIGGNVIVQPFNGVGGTVSLSVASGNVSTRLISTNGQQIRNYENDANGGAISIEAANGSINTGSLYSYSYSRESTAGNGGAISLIAANDININITGDLDSGSFSNSGSAGNGGNISLTAANDININITGDLDSGSFSNSGSAGNGGNISLFANDININITGALSSGSFSNSGSTGNGGAISLVAANGINITGKLVSFSYSESGSGQTGNGGNISLRATNDINIKGSLFSLSSSKSGTAGNGGNISLVASNGSIFTSDLFSLSSSKSGTAGNGGNIRLVASNGSISTNDLLSFSDSESGSGQTGNAGDISLRATNGSISTGVLRAFSSSKSGTAGNGGNISLATNDGRISTRELFSLSFSNFGMGGNGGNISVLASNDINITGGLFSYSYSQSGTVGNGGNISVFATNGSISTGFLFSSSYSDFGTAGNGGNISLVTTDGSISTRDLFSLSSSNFGTAGNGGNISLFASNGSISTTFLYSYSSSNFGTAGNGGNISLFATNGSISTNDLFSLSYSNSGLGGNGNNISLFATNTIKTGSINSTGWLSSGNITIVSNVSLALDNSVISSDTFGSGRGGDILISAPSISLSNGAQISASTHSSGRGGNIALIASESVELSGATTEVPKGIFSDQTGLAQISPGTFLGGFIPTGKVPPTVNGVPQFPSGTLFPSGVFTQTTQSSTGSAGNISIETGRLIIKDRAAIGTTTFGQNSNAGNISVQALDSISLDNGSIKSGVAGGARGNSGNITVNTNTLSAVNGGQLLTSTSGDGQAGDITVNAKEIQLSGSNSGLFAQTSSAANAGNMTLQPLGEGQTLTVNFFGGAQISASTGGSGRGGNLTITAPESITLIGNGSIISAETSGSGKGGDLTLQTGRLTVRDGAQVTVSSTGTGNAGNLNVFANSVLLDNQGQIIAKTASGEGGNIRLQVEDLLLMRHNSLISAEAGNNGNGGNITINAPFIVAVPRENSDIIANAFRGRGGNINITTQGMYGLEYRPRLTPYSDITASSEFGVNGTVQINAPDVDPSRGLTNLPTEVVDASNQIDQACSPGDGKAEKNEFIVTGRGGLPPSPNEMLSSDAVWEDRRTLSADSSSRNSKPAATRADAPQQPIADRQPQIVEANGWVINDKGEVVLTASAPNVTPQGTRQVPVNCQVSATDSNPIQQ